MWPVEAVGPVVRELVANLKSRSECLTERLASYKGVYLLVMLSTYVQRCGRAEGAVDWELLEVRSEAVVLRVVIHQQASLQQLVRRVPNACAKPNLGSAESITCATSGLKNTPGIVFMGEKAACSTSAWKSTGFLFSTSSPTSINGYALQCEKCVSKNVNWIGLDDNADETFVQSKALGSL